MYPALYEQRVLHYIIEERKSPVYFLKLLQKFNFQTSSTKSDNKGHPPTKTGQIWSLGGFKDGFHFLRIKNS